MIFTFHKVPAVFVQNSCLIRHGVFFDFFQFIPAFWNLFQRNGFSHIGTESCRNRTGKTLSPFLQLFFIPCISDHVPQYNRPLQITGMDNGFHTPPSCFKKFCRDILNHKILQTDFFFIIFFRRNLQNTQLDQAEFFFRIVIFLFCLLDPVFFLHTLDQKIFP